MTAPPELEPINLAIGERLRLARMMRGVTQEELGYTLGLTFQQIQKYEKAVNRIPAARLWLIAKALDLPPAYFYEGLESAFDAEAAAAAAEMLDFISSSEGAALIDRFRAIPSEEARAALMHLMTTMARESTKGSGD